LPGAEVRLEKLPLIVDAGDGPTLGSHEHVTAFDVAEIERRDRRPHMAVGIDELRAIEKLHAVLAAMNMRSRSMTGPI
jgi:hypothetical protein